MSVRFDWIEKELRIDKVHEKLLPNTTYSKIVKNMSFVLQNKFEDQKLTSRDIGEIPFTPERDNALPYFKSCFLATILEEVMTKLRILAECNNEIRICKTMSDMKVLLAIKYGVKQLPQTDELADIDPNNLTCMEYKIRKLDADKNYFSEVVKSTYIDLSLNRTFQALTDHVNQRISRDDYRLYIAEEETKNKGCVHDLRRQLRQQRNHIKTVIYDTDTVIDTLKSQVEDAGVYAETRSRYVDGWQRARTEQHIQTIKDEEFPPTETIEYFKRRSDHEQRVHYEVDLLINIGINETLEKVENWMAKYDKDMEAIDLKIQIKKNDYQNQLDTRLDLERTIEKHDEMMKAWNHFKEEREKARLYREKMTNSAITVQAWWRGLLVRLQLGPYKVAKKKGAQAKKK